MAIECEAKIKVENLDEIRDRLRQRGGVDKGEVFERNWVLDRPENDLYESGILLRVRNTGGRGGVLTVKCRMDEGEFKCREEVETEVDSTESLLWQLQMAGFEVKWIYEKRRATWRFRGCEIVLDRLPEIGGFVEIEGEAGNIYDAARDLGLDPGEHLNCNYLSLWEEHLSSCGEERRHMVFPCLENWMK